MRVIVIGTVQFSLEMVDIVNQYAELVGVITSNSSKFNSDYADLSPYCKDYSIPCLQISDVNSDSTLDWVKEKNADIIFCLGWSSLIRQPLLRSVPMGVVGYHPTALPKNRGRHPLIWALVLGLKETASTFFFMDEGADSGDIISQVDIKIAPDDNALSLYSKTINTARQQLSNLLVDLKVGNYTRISQKGMHTNTWRKRSEVDGQIDWRMSDSSIYNLIRALSRPYVGAHFMVGRKVHIVWNSSIIECLEVQNVEPGKILKVNSEQLIVKCGDGCIELNDIEPPVVVKQGDYL